MLVLWGKGMDSGRQKLVIDPESMTVQVDETLCRLTEQEFQLLFVLASQKNRVLTRDELLRTVWGFITPGPTRTVDVHMQRLRKKTDLRCIETVLGKGYRLCAEENV